MIFYAAIHFLEKRGIDLDPIYSEDLAMLFYV
jgi:hypothetical protein